MRFARCPTLAKKKLISYICWNRWRILETYKNYFWDFYNPLEKKVKEKVDYVLQVVISVQHIPRKFFKHLEDGLYEIRIDYKGDIFRIVSFFDEGKLIILLHGFQKKTQKTPRNEILKAKKLRKDYYEGKGEDSKPKNHK